MEIMKRILGLVVGVLYLGLAFQAFRFSAQGRAMGGDDLAFWWGVIATLLSIAATGALVGTLIHTRQRVGD